MIVCRLCGNAADLSHGGSVLNCRRCSGRVVEQNSLSAVVLTPSHRRGGLDRWAQNYTHASPVSDNGSATPSREGCLSVAHLRACDEQPLSGNTVDVPLGNQELELARVYGSVLDPRAHHPICTVCGNSMSAGQKIYLAPRRLLDCGLEEGQELCRQCYTAHFSLGSCVACGQAVLGEKGDRSGGRFMRHSLGQIWHSACFTCSRCAAPLHGKEHLVFPGPVALCMQCTDAEDPIMNLPSSRPTEKAVIRAAGRYGKPGQVLGSMTPAGRSGVRGSVDHGSTNAVQSLQEAQPDPCDELAHPVTTVVAQRGDDTVSSLQFTPKVPDRHDSHTARITNVPLRSSDQSSRTQSRAADSATPPQSRLSNATSVRRCPICLSIVGIAERGVIKGPQGILWHRNCLRCGKQAAGNSPTGSRTGCGKPLDGSAVQSKEGYVWCRACSI